MYYNTSPSTQSGYSVHFSKSFRERDRIAVPTGFQAIFKNAEVFYSPDSDTFSYDVERANTRIAAYIKRGSIGGDDLDAKQVEDGKFTNFTRFFPLSQEKTFVPSNATLRRQAGEKLSEMTRRERLQAKLETLYKEHTRRIIRLNEYAAASVIQTGKMPYVVGSTTDIIDFKRISGNTIACGTTWDNSGAPQTNFQAAVLQAESVGHLSPDVLILESYSAKALFSETSIKALSDTRGYSFIEAGALQCPPHLQHLVDGGFLYRGQMTLPNCPTLFIFVCRETYVNSSGVVTPYMTAKTALLLNSQAEYRIYIGPTGKNDVSPIRKQEMEDLVGINPDLEVLPPEGDNILLPNMVEHDLYENTDHTGYIARTQSSVVFAPVHTDSIIQLTGCAT